jgi:hypothetical protein
LRNEETLHHDPLTGAHCPGLIWSSFKEGRVSSCLLHVGCVQIIRSNFSISQNGDGCSFKVSNASFAPRELGGWDIPHIISRLIQETPDTLASYIINRSILQSLCPQEITKQNVRINLKTTITQDFQRVGIKTLHPSPRCVHAMERQIQLALS